MSSYSRSWQIRPFRLATLSLIGSALLFGCSFSPLYSVKPSQTPIQNELATIEVHADRVIYNELNFLLKNGLENQEIRYALNIIITETPFSSLVQSLHQVPNPQSFTISGRFSLKEKETGRVVFSGTTFSRSSYYTTSQRYANLRAHRDAIIKAKKELARNLHSRMSTYFSGRQLTESINSG